MKAPSSKDVISIIFILFAVAFFIIGEYGYAVLLLFGFLVIIKLDDLTYLAMNYNEGFKAKFKTPKEKIEEDIKDNKQSLTPLNFIRFQDIKSKILADQQNKYGNEMKTLIHFLYGAPDNPEFLYTPDGSLQTDDALYFFEIKYIINSELVINILEKTTKYLETVYSAFAPSTGKKLIIKLILASGHNIDLSSFTTPEGIELEFIKIE